MTDIQRDARGRFLPGHNFSQGKSRGARNRIGTALLEAIADDFEKHGSHVVEVVREERPVDYLKICLSVLPKDLTLNINPLDTLSDEDLYARAQELQRAYALHTGRTNCDDGGIAAPDDNNASAKLPALPAPK
ncbi:MAG: hypothetical protein RIB43_17260 [Rhodospirillaceae bacterium]